MCLSHFNNQSLHFVQRLGLIIRGTWVLGMQYWFDYALLLCTMAHDSLSNLYLHSAPWFMLVHRTTWNLCRDVSCSIRTRHLFMTYELVLTSGLMNIKVRENAGQSVYCIRVQCSKCFVLYLGIDCLLWNCEACRSSRYLGLVHPLLIVVFACKS